MSTEEPKTLDLMDDDLEDVEGVEIPAELSVLALRGAMLYPYMVLPIHVGRGKSRQLIDDVAVGPRILAVAAQFDEKEEDPKPGDLHGTGTACRILRLMKLPDGTFRVLIQGLKRVRLTEYTAEEPYLKARVEEFADEGGDSAEVGALANTAKELFRRLVGIANALSDDLLVALDAITDPARLADFIGANLLISIEDKQKILDAGNVADRLKIVNDLIGHELGVAEIQKEIQGKVKESIGEKNREAILRQQMEAIRSELGEDDARSGEIDELREKIEAAGMPEEALEAATKELDRLARMHPSAAEYTVSRTYLDWMISVPWAEETIDQLDVKEAKRILDEDHHGLEKVKDRILEFLSVLKLKKDLKGSILCLVGPPGVG